VKKQVAACAIQLLFSGSRAFSIEALREKLRELLVDEVDPALRRVASVSAVDLVAALLAANSRLKEVGLQVRVTGGMVSLWAGPVKGKKMAAFLSEAIGESGDPVLTESLMEVLGCVHLKQPIWQAQQGDQSTSSAWNSAAARARSSRGTSPKREPIWLVLTTRRQRLRMSGTIQVRQIFCLSVLSRSGIPAQAERNASRRPRFFGFSSGERAYLGFLFRCSSNTTLWTFSAVSPRVSFRDAR